VFFCVKTHVCCIAFLLCKASIVLLSLPCLFLLRGVEAVDSDTGKCSHANHRCVHLSPFLFFYFFIYIFIFYTLTYLFYILTVHHVFSLLFHYFFSLLSLFLFFRSNRILWSQIYKSYNEVVMIICH